MTKKKTLLASVCIAASALLWSIPVLATPADLDAALVSTTGELPSGVEGPGAKKAESADCDSAAVPALPGFLMDVDTKAVKAGGEASWGGGNNCVGTLNYFIAPACQACNVNRISCTSACNSRGGVKFFSCSTSGIECECNDGAYDSCGCGW